MSRVIPEVLMLRHDKRVDQAGWSFPRQIETHLRELTAGRTVLQLFGGRSRWGVRLDIDPSTSPDVIGDAWLPPFKRDSFDYVIVDPPYEQISAPWWCELMVRAAWIARVAVIWWNTKWFEPLRPMTIERSWLVGLGNYYQVRCLIVFAVHEPKRAPGRFFAAGPAVKYNWPLAGQTSLRFGG